MMPISPIASGTARSDARALIVDALHTESLRLSRNAASRAMQGRTYKEAREHLRARSRECLALAQLVLRHGLTPELLRELAVPR